MLENTAKNVCGKIRRELVASTLEVFPIKDCGAIAQGVHRFCRIDTGRCEGMADFVVVWRQQDDQWQMTACSASTIARSMRSLDPMVSPQRPRAVT